MIDLDTVASPGSWEAALHSAGGAVHAAERLLDEAAGSPSAACARPGHHAERDRAMGFCLFNNVAVARRARASTRRGAERVLILDWDVHHGNGTEAIFYGSAEVLYASIHQSPLYPGTGAAGDIGSGEGEGYTVNLPVPPGSGPDEFLSLVQHVVVADRAGVAAGAALHLGRLRRPPRRPARQLRAGRRGATRDMAATMRDLAGELGAPVLVCLEGGYALGALARSVVATLERPRRRRAAPGRLPRRRRRRHRERPRVATGRLPCRRRAPSRRAELLLELAEEGLREARDRVEVVDGSKPSWRSR